MRKISHGHYRHHPVEEPHGPHVAPMSTMSHRKWCVRRVWGIAVYSHQSPSGSDATGNQKKKKKRVIRLSKHADAWSHETMLRVPVPTLIKISFTYRLRNILTVLQWRKKWCKQIQDCLRFLMKIDWLIKDTTNIRDLEPTVTYSCCCSLICKKFLKKGNFFF